jgi:prepilin-type processing-associated H-X9-DG protein
MFKVTVRKATEPEVAFIAGWAKPGCLLSGLLGWSARDPFARALRADAAAGVVEEVTLSAAEWAYSTGEAEFAVVGDGAGNFLYLDGRVLAQLSVPVAERDGAGPEIQLSFAPRSRLVTQVIWRDNRSEVEDRRIPGPSHFFDCLLVRSSWERLPDDLAAAARTHRDRFAPE